MVFGGPRTLFQTLCLRTDLKNPRPSTRSLDYSFPTKWPFSKKEFIKNNLKEWKRQVYVLHSEIWATVIIFYSC